MLTFLCAYPNFWVNTDKFWGHQTCYYPQYISDDTLKVHNKLEQFNSLTHRAEEDMLPWHENKKSSDVTIIPSALDYVNMTGTAIIEKSECAVSVGNTFTLLSDMDKCQCSRQSYFQTDKHMVYRVHVLLTGCDCCFWQAAAMWETKLLVHSWNLLRCKNILEKIFHIV